MAEERLIDDDKDKKYRIRVNENGEEELVIDPDAEETLPEDELFEVPEDAVDKDDEEEAVMTPEQLAAKREREEKERREREERLAELIERAKKDCRSNRFATALEYLEQAEELDDTNGEIYATRLVAYTRNLTDYSQITDAAESAEGIAEYLSDERKQELYEKCGGALEENIASLRNKVVALDKMNEEKKAERAAKFTKDRNNALYVFLPVLALFMGFLGTAIYYLLVIFTENTGLYLTLTIVFGVLAFVALIVAAFAARKLNIACHRLRMNKRNTSSQLGRDFLAEQDKLKAFIAVNNSLKVK